MKALFINLILIIFSFSNSEVLHETSVIKSELLRQKLDKQLAYHDKLTQKDDSYSDMKSYWIVFDNKNNQSEISLIANFKYYSSKNMIGYFTYKGKIVSVYEFHNSDCGNFINKTELKKGVIESLIDYDSNKLVGEHEPEIRKYKVEKNNKLVKIR